MNIFMAEPCIREILPTAEAFKTFWKARGPFAYALTSKEFPPVLLAPEEWIFGNDRVAVLKELMGFSKEKMAFVRAPFNPDNTAVLRPENLCAWKLRHFPEAWNGMVCDAFVPEGHLTRAVMDELVAMDEKEGSEGIASAFFSLLARQLDGMGYVLIGPGKKYKYAATRSYLEEWEADDADAGL